MLGLCATYTIGLTAVILILQVTWDFTRSRRSLEWCHQIHKGDAESLKTKKIINFLVRTVPVDVDGLDRQVLLWDICTHFDHQVLVPQWFGHLDARYLLRNIYMLRNTYVYIQWYTCVSYLPPCLTHWGRVMHINHICVSEVIIIQIMACGLAGAKPLSEPMLE